MPTRWKTLAARLLGRALETLFSQINEFLMRVLAQLQPVLLIRANPSVVEHVKLSSVLLPAFGFLYVSIQGVFILYQLQTEGVV